MLCEIVRVLSYYIDNEHTVIRRHEYLTKTLTHYILQLTYSYTTSVIMQHRSYSADMICDI